MTHNKDLDRLLELARYGAVGTSYNDEYQSLKSQIESKLAQTDKRLTPLGIKWVQCIKCKKDYVEFYPKQQCICGSYESEEVDALLTDLLNDSRELSQLRPIVQALREEREKILKEKCWLCEGKDKDCTECKNGINSWNRLEFIESILTSSEVKQ